MNCIKCGKKIPDDGEELCKRCKKEEEKRKDSGDDPEKIEVSNENGKSNKLPLMIIIGVAVLVLILLFVCFFPIGKGNGGVKETLISKSKVGNSIGNIKNYGYSAKGGSNIFYVAPNQNSTAVCLYKVKYNDKTPEPVELFNTTGDILSINAKDGYIYFISFTGEAYSETDDTDNKLYRCKYDGTELEVINDNEFANDCYEIYVIENKIYYIGVDFNIYTMNTDGTDKKVLIENEAGYLCVSDKYIVYNRLNDTESDYVTYISDINGNNEKQIIENTRLYGVNIVDDTLFFANENKQLCKFELDSSNQTLLVDATAYNMNATKDCVYYLNYNMPENDEDKATVCIYKVNTKDENQTPEIIKTFQTYSNFINVVGDYILYTDSNETDGFINLLKLDGSGEEINLYNLNYEEYYESITEYPADSTNAQAKEEKTENTAESAENTVEETNTTNTANTTNTTNEVKSN